MANLKDIRGRIASVKNIRKITRAMEMISAARLRKAEQRIEALRPYADALRRMTARASQAADNIPNLPILQEKENVETVGVLLDHGRPRPRRARSTRRSCAPATGACASCAATARRCSGTRWGAAASRRSSSASSRSAASWTGFTDRPVVRRRPPRGRRARLRLRGRQGRPRRGLLQRLHLGGEPGGSPRDAAAAAAGRCDRRRRRVRPERRPSVDRRGV